MTSEYLDQPTLFATLHQHSPYTQIILCTLPNALNLDQLWPLVDKVDVDSVCSIAELADCLRATAGGRFFASTLLATHSLYAVREPLPGWHDLTQSERRILRLLAEGQNGPQIAAMLFISPKTVNNHKNKIAQKLNISGGPDSLTRFALQNNPSIIIHEQQGAIRSLK